MKKLILPLAFLLAGCGVESTLKPQKAVFPTTYTNSPMMLEKYSSVCGTTYDSGSSLDFQLKYFFNGMYNEGFYNFDSLLKGNLLRDGKTISNSLYGEKTELVTFNGATRFIPVKKPQRISFCPEENYPENTIEMAALKTSFFILKTAERFKKAVPELNITPVTLNISPLIERSILTVDHSGSTIKQSTYMTDNAFYMPSTKTIAFLPHSMELKGRMGVASFWEVPTIASHEYGHHLFEMIYPSLPHSSKNFSQCFGAKKLNSNRKLLVRNVKIEDVIGSYNEGFADLVSHYTLDPLERNVSGVHCLEVTRDVESPMLYNGKPKIFSKEALQSYFSTYPDHFGGSCQHPSFQDTHTLGAIFAHNADVFLSLFTTSPHEKLAALVEWVKFLKSERKKYHLASPEKYLEETFSSFLRMTLVRFNGTFDSTVCEKVEKMYPDLDINEC